MRRPRSQFAVANGQKNIRTWAGLNKNRIPPFLPAYCERRKIRGQVRREVWLPRHGYRKRAGPGDDADHINPRRAPTTKEMAPRNKNQDSGSQRQSAILKLFDLQGKESSTLKEGIAGSWARPCWVIFRLCRTRRAPATGQGENTAVTIRHIRELFHTVTEEC